MIQNTRNTSKRNYNESEKIHARYIRLPISILLVVISSIGLIDEGFITSSPAKNSLIYSAIYAIASLLLVIHINHKPPKSTIRDLLSTFIDLLTLSVLGVLNSVNILTIIPLYLIYGMEYAHRYGIKHLLFTAAISGLVIIYSINFSNNTGNIDITIAITFMAMFIYAYYYIKRSESSYTAIQSKEYLLSLLADDLNEPLKRLSAISRNSTDNYSYKKQIDMSACLINSFINTAKLDIDDIQKSEKLNYLEEWSEVIKIAECFHSDGQINLTFNADPSTPYYIVSNKFLLTYLLLAILKNDTYKNKSIHTTIKLSSIPHTKEKLLIRIEIHPWEKNSAHQNKFIINPLSPLVRELLSLLGGKSDIINGSISHRRYEIPVLSTQINFPNTALKGKRVLLLSSKKIGEQVRPLLERWGVQYKYTNTTAATYKLLLEEDCYDALILDKSVIKDHDPFQFSDVILDEELHAETPLILIGPANSIVNYNTIHHRYFSFIDYLDIDNYLFPAIHYSQYLKAISCVYQDKGQDNSTISSNNSAVILIAEDNEVNRKLTKKILLNNGYTVHVVENGEEAKNIIVSEHLRPDLIILDLNMPKLDGITLTKFLKQDKNTSHIPIIIVSAEPSCKSEAACLESGAERYLPKPLNTTLLLTTIRTLVEPHSTQKESFGSTPAINETKLKKLQSMSNGQDFINELISSYKHDVFRSLGVIKKAQSNDYKKYREKLHAIKSSSYEIGAVAVVQQCIKCEEFTENDIDSNKIQSSTNELNEIIAQSIVVIENNLNI